MESTYAQALMSMVARGMSPKDAVGTLQKLLVRLGRESLMPKIGRAFARLAAREQARSGVTLSIAHEKGLHAAERDIKQILSDMGVEKTDVTTQVDESLIGGWRLEGQERLVDMSFKKQLLSIYNRTTQS